ncbi:MAG: response regulator [Euryarchaeota archaeon]|nr:response regulator [Euryarchaeota archaeon]
MRGRSVLLVEDSEDDVLIVKRAFKVLKLPHDLAVCRNGEEAAQRLDKPAPRPDLVLLDLNLPGLSGLEVLRRLKADARSRAVPIVVLSASDRDADVASAYEAGANHYLVKPLHFEAFVELIRKWNEYWTQLGRLPPRN